MSDLKDFAKRPRSLRDVSQEVCAGRDYASSMKEFIDVVAVVATAPDAIDGFYGFPASLYSEEPVKLPETKLRVHLAAMAEYLAILSGREPPAWCLDEDVFLKEPIFTGGRRSRPLLVAQTPSAFRRRLLFCGPALEKLFRLKPRPKAA